MKLLREKMIIAIFPNLAKKQTKQTALDIISFLKARQIQVVTEEEKAEELGIPSLNNFPANEINFLISLGGDGTLLQVLHRHADLPAPIVGINMGGLGFMADITVDEIYPRLQDILDGNFNVQERLMADGFLGDKSYFAINDIVIHRGKNTSLVELLIRVGELYLSTYSADGLVISTPNGSTAYSLAAGGPILSPDLDAFVITPISPHTISNRPLVIKSDQEIEVEYHSDYDPVEINYDGFAHHSLSKGDVLKVRASRRKFKLVSFKKHDFFSTLRKKLGWAGKLKS